MLGACVARLVRSCEADGRDSATSFGDARPSSRQVYGALYGDSSVRQALSRVGRYVGQRTRLREWRRSGGTSLCAVALNSRRFTASGLGGVRAYLESLAVPLPGVSSGRQLADSIRTADGILVCDPVMCSPLWNDAASHWAERVFIVDGAFLLFTVLTSPAAMWRVLVGSLRHLARAVRWRDESGIRDCIAGFMLTAGYDRLFARTTDVRCVLFTANSFLTEMLRVRLLQHDRCASVVEVLHGTPTRDYESYVQTVLDVSDHRHKHLFVPQVPLPGIPVPFDRTHGDIAVNGYVNHYFLVRPHARAHPVEFVRREWERLAVGSTSTRPFVVAFVGATSHDPDFLRSDAFNVERALIERIRAVLSESGIPYVILYTPHPTHGMSMVRSHPFFQAADLRLHPDTVFAWFVADACVGLYSSALFEAWFCGIPTFTPVMDRDNVYTEALLDLLAHPSSDSALNQALTGFLLTAVPDPHVARIARAAGRIARINALAAADGSSNQSQTSSPPHLSTVPRSAPADAPLKADGCPITTT
jgi:hypothetical protein